VEENTFYLLCYKRDLKCLEAERELASGRNAVLTAPQYSMIASDLVPQIRVVECIQGANHDLCKALRHNLHELMPPRIKIVAARTPQEL
jgi:hypothetical protein